MAEETRKRKAEHIKICLEQKAQARKTTTGFEQIHLIHKALPEVDRTKIDLSTIFLGHKFSAPIIIGAMTGGTEEATRINATIAEIAEKLGLGMGVGSQRAAIEDKSLAETFAVARKKAPHAFLIANIGGVQLVHGYGVKEASKAVNMIEADALAIHLNALQEAVQPEGQTDFAGVLKKISELSQAINIPIIVKETGAGIAAEEARKIEAAGAKAIDIGGSGGTSFAAVEYHRSKESSNRFQAKAFWDWGIPSAVSLIESAQSVKIPLIASGGLRTGTDFAKALALGASICSVSQPILEAATNGTEETEKTLMCFVDELRNTMFLTGTENVDGLTKVPLVITGKPSKWLTMRGFNIQSYAKRGTN